MRINFFLTISLFLIFCFTAVADELCGTWDTEVVSNGEYIVQNNVWGATTTQCINVNGASFSVTRSDHNNTGGDPAAYPSIYKGCHWEDCTDNSGMPIQVSQVQNATIDWNVSLAGSGTWNVTTEAWFKTNSTPGAPDGAELMIWINHMGGIQPGGSQIGTANIAGYTWQVWQTYIGWNFITYRITSPITSVSLDYRPFIDDAMSRGFIQSSWYMMDIEAGFEIWQGGVGLTVNSFSCAVNQGGVVTNPPTTPPVTNPPATNPPVSNLGDVNNSGSVDIVDALMIAQYYVGLNPPNFDYSRADVNCNGSVDIVDALQVAQYYVGILTSFC